MEPWRAQALTTLPELEQEIRAAETPMRAWINIRSAFERAYEDPRNEDLIRRVYEYASWSLRQDDSEASAEDHLPTCVLACFYESIPTIEAARLDMARWFTRQEVLSLREVFTYLYDGDFEQLLGQFPVSVSRRKTKRRKAQ